MVLAVSGVQQSLRKSIAQERIYISQTGKGQHTRRCQVWRQGRYSSLAKIISFRNYKAVYIKALSGIQVGDTQYLHLKEKLLMCMALSLGTEFRASLDYSETLSKKKK